MVASWRAQTASTGTLALNPAGDTLTVTDGVTVLATVSYGPQGATGQSLTRDPDLADVPLVLHLSAAGAFTPYSPGRRVDLTAL